jgi:3-phenylpropionate/cinnamic acid dioxygenase small subunit
VTRDQDTTEKNQEASVATNLDLLVAKDEITDALNQLFVSTDERDWPRVQQCFANAVEFDMTSLAGGEPVQMSPKEITAAWEEGLRPIEASHHQVSNYQIVPRGDEANASCYGIALHYRKTQSGRNTRTFVGTYDFHLRRDEKRWRVDMFRFNLKYLDGNLELETSD